jgi:hypothetical protein
MSDFQVTKRGLRQMAIRADNYRGRLYLMIASTVPEKAAWALYESILKLNEEQLELHIFQHQQSNIHHTAAGAIKALLKETGPEHE